MSIPRFVAVADHAVLVEFGTVADSDVHQAVLRLDRAIAATPPPGFRETVPAMINLLVDFDPLLTDHAEITRSVEALLDVETVAGTHIAAHEIAVCYEDTFAPDLADVAAATGLSAAHVIAAHCAGTYNVRMYGFAPGYAYLGGVPDELQLPRKPAPVRDVPAGSVLIAGAQCLISTLTMPTGWWIIGRSPALILQDDPDRPFLFDVGDRVAFRAISRTEFEASE